MAEVLFPNRWREWIATELRRQGASHIEEWCERVLTHTQLTEAVPRPNASASDAAAFQGCALQVDLANLHVTDKVTVAVVEALLRLYAAVESTSEGSLTAADRALRGDWSVSFRGNELTDVSVPHLSLLVQTCQCLSRLDLRGNMFSAGCKTDMLGAMSGAPCDVILNNGPVALSTHSSSDSAKTPGSPSKEKPPPTQAAAETAADASKAPPSTTHAPPSAVRGQSCDVASSVASSRLSFASGSAEALRRRREGLFSKTRTASPSTAAPAASAGSDTMASAPLPATTAADAPKDTAEQTPHDPLKAHDDKDDCNTDGDGRARTGGSAAGVLFASTPPRPTHAQAPLASTSPFHDDAGHAAGASRQHEPFYGDAHDDGADRNDQLDLTSNLNPILDSVLDLAGTVARDGRTLREPEVFGDADSVWDVLDAYESAVEESMLGAGGAGDGSIDPNTSARLPASLLSSRAGAFTALTVLNLAKNNLAELRVLPATLLRLDVSSNQLVRIAGLEKCKMLTVLNVRRNQLVEISGLDRNLCLAHVFLGHNKITLVEGLAHLLLLETLDLSFNRLRTQGSLRALSLSSSLRHLLIRGNPVMEKLQQGFKPVLRNLCPSLLVIDDVKLSGSRFAETQQVFRSTLRQPDRTGAKGGAGAGNGRLLRAGSQVRGTPADASAAAPELPDDNAMNLLHLLTRGVTAPTGYGDGAKVAQTSKAMASRAAREGEMHKRRKEREVTAGGVPLRTTMMTKLAAASKEYLEATLVDRMTAAQSQPSHSVHAHSPNRQGEDDGGDDEAFARSPQPSRPTHPLPRGRVPQDVAGTTPSVSVSQYRDGSRPRQSSRSHKTAYGAVVDPLTDSPIPDVMGYARVPPSVLATSSTAANETRPSPRGFSEGREASAPHTTTDPLREQTGFDVVLAPYAPKRRGSQSPAAVHRHHHSDPERMPRSTRSSRARAQSTAQRQEAYNALVAAQAAAERSNPEAADVTLDAIYEYHSDDDVEMDAVPQRRSDSAQRGGSQAPPRNPTARTGGGYADLHASSAFTGQPPHGPSYPPFTTGAAPHQAPRRSGSGQAEELTDVDELGISPIPHRSAALRAKTTAAADTGSTGESMRRGSPALQPPPPMHTGSRARAPVNYLVGRSKKLRREAVTGDREDREEAAVAAPLRIDDAQAQRVHSWVAELNKDTTAVQMTLKTMVSLLEAQRQSGMPFAEHSRELPRTYLEERQRSVRIIEESGMLHDITVPAEVALYYGFSKRDLDGDAASSSPTTRSLPRTSRSRGATRSQDRGAGQALLHGWSPEESEREEVRRSVRVMGDAKTCLRYLLLLMGGGKERLLQEYVDQIKSIV